MKAKYIALSASVPSELNKAGSSGMLAVSPL